MNTPTAAAQTKDNPLFSVIIGMVSTEDSDRILETLSSLKNQTGDHTYEVIIADRRHDHIVEQIAKDYPQAQLISCDKNATLPELRTAALDRARGTYVLVTEDHCVPSSNLLDAFATTLASLDEQYIAVGGCVENGVDDTSLDWATFLCEYSVCLSPVPEGDTESLPGMNVAYRRDFLMALDRDMLTKGFWETTVHPEILRRGLKMYSSNAIVMYHCKKFSFQLFASQRFIYSRYFAGLRFNNDQLPQRLVATLLSFILPPLLLLRMTRNVTSKKRLLKEYIFALPYLFVFVIIWSFGEIVGYLAGQKDALAKIE